jgi:hypothetical protein
MSPDVSSASLQLLLLLLLLVLVLVLVLFLPFDEDEEEEEEDCNSPSAPAESAARHHPPDVVVGPVPSVGRGDAGAAAGRPRDMPHPPPGKAARADSMNRHHKHLYLPATHPDPPPRGVRRDGMVKAARLHGYRMHGVRPMFRLSEFLNLVSNLGLNPE